MIRRAAAAALCVALALTLSGFSPAPKRFQAEFFGLFDTVTTLVGYAPDRESFTAVAEQARDMLREYHELYDIYNAYDGLNNLKTLNDTAAHAPVQVDARIIGLIEFARAMYEETGGAVNIAMGAVLRIWHEARMRGVDNPQDAAVPDMDALRRAADHTGFDDVIVDREASTVYFADPYLKLDVGAVAKGYAVEHLARRLEETGVRNLLISVGGNVRAVGGKPGGAREVPWYVSVADPQGGDDLCAVNVFSSAVVSSGGYLRYFTVGGVEYHHIIDPETLMPARQYLGVTVRCRDSGLADALTTALFNMPLEKGYDFALGKQGVEALWVFPDGTVLSTPGFFAVETSAP
jgi:thiamine biosynthesis lipoprotein